MNCNAQAILYQSTLPDVLDIYDSDTHLGGRPLLSGRRRKPLACQTPATFPEFTRLPSDTNHGSPFLTVLTPQVLPLPATRVKRGTTAGSTGAYLWRECQYLCHWLLTATVTAIVATVSTVVVAASLGYDRCRRRLHQHPPTWVAGFGRSLANPQHTYDAGGETGTAWCA